MTCIEVIQRNYENIKCSVENAAFKVSRSSKEIKIVVVTKTVSSSTVNLLWELGIKDIGESRVQDAILKSKNVDSDFSWHLVGHLQTNKIKKALTLFDTIHSIDSIDLAAELQKVLKIQDKVIDGFIEVNTSGEITKFGVKPWATKDLVDFIRSSCKNINLLGLMTVAPIVKNKEDARPYFRKLKELAYSLDLSGLSMGMTQDYEIAVEEGATYLRIGSAFFEGVK
jgi:hypothetical protein